MSTTETSAVTGRRGGVTSGRLGGGWPLIGIGAAVAANAVWIALLVYGLFRLL